MSMLSSITVHSQDQNLTCKLSLPKVTQALWMLRFFASTTYQLLIVLYQVCLCTLINYTWILLSIIHSQPLCCVSLDLKELQQLLLLVLHHNFSLCNLAFYAIPKQALHDQKCCWCIDLLICDWEVLLVKVQEVLDLELVSSHYLKNPYLHPCKPKAPSLGEFLLIKIPFVVTFLQLASYSLPKILLAFIFLSLTLLKFIIIPSQCLILSFTRHSDLLIFSFLIPFFASRLSPSFASKDILPKWILSLFSFIEFLRILHWHSMTFLIQLPHQTLLSSYPNLVFSSHLHSSNRIKHKLMTKHLLY